MKPATPAAILIEALGQRLGLPGLACDTNGRCVLTFDARLHVQIIADAQGESIILVAVLGKAFSAARDLAPPIEQHDTLAVPLVAGPLLVLERASGLLLLTERIDPALIDVESFAHRLDAFVEMGIDRI